jgi:hypothetical protein
LTALKEKYKDDPTKFSQKQMEFFRENKINPVAGCLPMLVQLPVFFGLFMMLRTAIELRGASFLWAADSIQGRHDLPDSDPRAGFLPVQPVLYAGRAATKSPAVALHRHRHLADAHHPDVSDHGCYAAEVDAVDAAVLPRVPLQLLLRSRALHDRQQPVDHLPDLDDETESTANCRPTAPVIASVLTPTSKKKK